jgi:nucleotide-binding universal stress UspA family protein
MKAILVATDFSANALNAAYYATDMAKAINGYVVLLHVYQTPVTISEIPVTIDDGGLLNDAEREMTGLEKLLEQHTNGHVMIESKIRVGTFFHELESYCNETKPYAVVMGSQGSTAGSRFLFGTHALYAMKHLALPVIAVPPYIKFAAIRTIGLACDLNEVVDTTPVDELKVLVTDFNAELHVLNTGRKDSYDPNIVFQSGLLQEMLYSLHPKYHFLAADNIDDSIIEFAATNKIDLLIVLPKRHGLMDKLMHKSHTRQLVLHSHVPVMALHQ